MNNHILKKITKKTIIYPIGQVLLIFIGVTIATWFDNWNQERRENKFERTLLKEMIINLESDTIWIASEIRVINRGMVSAKKIIEILSDKDGEIDSLQFYMIDVLWYNTSIHNVSSYETIKSRGLDLIRNDILRQKITKYYEVELIDTKEQTERITYNLAWDYYGSILISKFKDFSLRHGTAPVNIDLLKRDNEFRQFLNLTIEFKGLGKRRFLRLKKSTSELIDAINAEIK